MSEIDTEFVHGDCIEKMKEMDARSVHAVVTDPPYGLAFMGNSWDEFEPKEYQQWCEEWATEALRVLKSGGHMLAFSGDRTFHRLMVGVEDAGFEVRDTVMWLHGQGFPKGSDIGKVIDKRADAEREKIPNSLADKQTGRYDSDALSGDREPNDTIAPEPATDVAKKWDGWNTQLKPAFEPIVVAQKPIEEDTIAEQVMATGTGALNIDGCRVEVGERPNRERSDEDTGTQDKYGEYKNDTSRADGTTTEGRYPANVVFDEVAADALDAEVGELETGDLQSENWSVSDGNNVYGQYPNGGSGNHSGDSGGPSRYFYTSKASKSERNINGNAPNDHPTVKPIDLMEWLVKMVSAEGQTVLDPFLGSGTTLLATHNLGRNGIGIEQKEEYLEIARDRVEANQDHPDEVGSYPDHTTDDPLEF